MPSLEPNALRRKLGQGKLVVGSVVYSWSAAIMDQAGTAGLDFVRIDSEHAWRRDGAMEDMVRTALANRVAPVVRVDRDDPYLVRKALEIGAAGVLVPDVRSVAEAEAVVRAAKFPPRGTRGYGSICVAGGWGVLSGPDWVRWSDTEPMIGGMIESVEAIEAIDAIMAVDGFDFVLFGPSDYSMSLGARTSLSITEPRVLKAIARTCAVARKAGKHVMLGLSSDAATLKTFVDAGVTMLEIGNDLAAVRSAWAGAVKAAAGFGR